MFINYLLVTYYDAASLYIGNYGLCFYGGDGSTVVPFTTASIHELAKMNEAVALFWLETIYLFIYLYIYLFIYCKLDGFLFWEGKMIIIYIVTENHNQTF